MREEMRSLTQGIIHSYGTRTTVIGALRRDVATQRQAAQAQLHELNRARQATAQQQRASLAKGRADLAKAEAQRKPRVKAWVREVAGARAEARQGWQGMAALMRSKRAGAVTEAPRTAEAPEGRGDEGAGTKPRVSRPRKRGHH